MAAYKLSCLNCSAMLSKPDCRGQQLGSSPKVRFGLKLLHLNQQAVGVKAWTDFG